MVVICYFVGGRGSYWSICGISVDNMQIVLSDLIVTFV